MFLGLPAEEESEGFDRTHLELPEAQLRLLEEVVAANSRTVVVLSNGGVVTLPFRDRVPAILEGWLLGQAGGSATADVLFGRVNPSGRLTETIPIRLVDTPSTATSPASSATSTTARASSSAIAGSTLEIKRSPTLRSWPVVHGVPVRRCARRRSWTDVVLVRLSLHQLRVTRGTRGCAGVRLVPESRVQRAPELSLRSRASRWRRGRPRSGAGDSPQRTGVLGHPGRRLGCGARRVPDRGRRIEPRHSRAVDFQLVGDEDQCPVVSRVLTR